MQGGGYINWAGTTYFHDALIPHNGQRLRVRFAKWDTRHLFVFDERNQLICTAEAAQAFAFFGEEGARTQAQRAQHLKRHLRDLRANTVRLDLETALQQRTALAEPPPSRPQGPHIALSPALQRMLEALQRLPAVPAAAPHSTASLSQWATPPNPLLQSLHDAVPDPAIDPGTLPLDHPVDMTGGAL